MSDERLRCAATALATVPETYLKVDAAHVVATECGHSLHHGMFVSWTWGEDRRGGPYLDFLSDHHHPGMSASRHYLSGRTQPIATPASSRQVSSDPLEDAKLEQEFFARNAAIYAELRDRGLLPESEVSGSLVINHHLLTGSSRLPATADSSAGEPNASAFPPLPDDWAELLKSELAQPYWSQLQRFVAAERTEGLVYPPPSQTFRAFELTAVKNLKVVILGQDPYIKPGQAHGLAFSVPAGIKIPPSLRKIRTELVNELSIDEGDLPKHGDLTGWAKQGVLLLNTTLTVRRGASNSHAGAGWEKFTDAVITRISSELEGVVFVLWGSAAQKKAKLIDGNRHPDPITAAHPQARPNALSQFAGSRPFTKIHEALLAAGKPPVDWSRLD